jgi:orotate phosphoribosyltransferase
VELLTSSKKKRLLEILGTTSYHYSETPAFPLSSGILSRHYIDCKKAFSDPEARRLIGELIFEKIYDLPARAIGGLAIGAYPIAIAASDVAYATKGQVLNAFVVRREPKQHGLKKYIEGAVKPGDQVIIVEDVITSGRSTIEAIERCREAGLIVLKAVSLIDREEENGRKNVEKEGIALDALFTLNDFMPYRDRR